MTSDFSSLLPSVPLALTDFNETNASRGFPLSIFPYLTPQELTFCSRPLQNGKPYMKTADKEEQSYAQEINLVEPSQPA